MLRALCDLHLFSGVPVPLTAQSQASSEVSHSETIVLYECKSEQIQAVIFRNTKVFLSRSDFFISICG